MHVRPRPGRWRWGTRPGGPHLQRGGRQAEEQPGICARLRNIRAHPQVAVLADHYEDDWDRLWWVRADGRALILDEPAAMAPALALLADRYPQYRAQPPAGPVLSIEVTRWTGWAAIPD